MERHRGRHAGWNCPFFAISSGFIRKMSEEEEGLMCSSRPQGFQGKISLNLSHHSTWVTERECVCVCVALGQGEAEDDNERPEINRSATVWLSVPIFFFCTDFYLPFQLYLLRTSVRGTLVGTNRIGEFLGPLALSSPQALTPTGDEVLC